jgi:hypothetical protein
VLHAPGPLHTLLATSKHAIWMRQRESNTCWVTCRATGCVANPTTGIFGDFGRFRSILDDFRVGTLPKHTQFPGSWLGTEHYLKSALVCAGARPYLGELPHQLIHS